MRVYPINVLKKENYNNQPKSQSAQSFKSHVPIPTNPYEILAGSAIVSGIILLTHFLITKIKENIKNNEENNTKQ